mgnify:CR=1 FL=1
MKSLLIIIKLRDYLYFYLPKNMERMVVQEHTFVVETFIRVNSICTKQREFRRYFHVSNVHWNYGWPNGVEKIQCENQATKHSSEQLAFENAWVFGLDIIYGKAIPFQVME